jgi:hypothetical protein
MRSGLIFAVAAAATAAATLPFDAPGAHSEAQAARARDHADLSGIWEALNTANWDLEDHSAQAGSMWQTGAVGAEPAGRGVVDGGAIPYLPAALEQKKANLANRRTRDPEAKCYLPGIPRANYMPFPFQIVQAPRGILFVYEFATANRLVNMAKPVAAVADSWMGTSNGRWEGDTLVIDVTGFNGLAWLDRAGNFASGQLHVVERFTLADRDHLQYEATIEDPAVFSRPWTIRMPLYRRVEKDAQILDFKCVEFAEELLYGEYKKK